MNGTFILSLDTEIAWGTYRNLDARAPAFDRYPDLLNRLIRLLNIYEIPATWAIVGHLLLEPGQRTPLADIQYSFANAPDSQRLANHNPGWFYGRYIVDAIQNARVPQEIGSHTMTHLLATDPAVTRDHFAAQLDAVTRLHAAHDLPPPRSLVYPQNGVAHTGLLPDYGFTTYRGAAADWHAQMPSPLKRPAHLLDRMMGFTPPTYTPADCLEADGLVNLPASQFLMSYDGVRAQIPTQARLRQARLGLADAIQSGGIYHLWFHPFNLGSSEAMFDALIRILSLVWEGRHRGQLTVMTMAQAADAIARQTAPDG